MSNLNITFKNKKYSIDKSLLSGSISSLETVLEGLSAGGDADMLPAGLYEAGAIALYEEQGASAVEDMMITSWEQLLADGVVHVNSGDIYTNLDPKTYQNSSSSILAGDLILPNDGAIVNFTESAFDSCAELTGICLSNTTTCIGQYAFWGCSKLTSIVVPSSVTEIDFSVFDKCDSMTNVYITDVAAWCNLNLDGYLSNPLSRTPNLYLNGELVTELVIPEGVTTIKKHTFTMWPSVTSVIMSNSVITIGDNAFWGCESLENMTFEGTISQWNAITKGQGWKTNVPATYVQCSDGQVAL